MKPFKNIATAIALSPNLEANICESIRLKDQLGEKLFLIHVDQGQADERAEIIATMQKVGCTTQDVEIVWEEGDPIEAILRVTKLKEIDLLVAGALPREGLLRYYRGSIARQLVRKSDCSILLMTNPQKLAHKCNTVVVNGLDHPKTATTIEKAIRACIHLNARDLHIIEEVSAKKKEQRVEDDSMLQKVLLKRKKLMESEDQRIQKILAGIDNKEGVNIRHQAVIGKRGYTIGHYTQSVHADLLVLNSPDTQLGFMDRVFTHDLEYILSELPSDILMVHSSK